jgi:5-methyltetrahydrofolate--homocysteine methyltransferase
VPVASSLISDELRNDFMNEVNKDYERVREQNKNAQSQNKFISIEEARANKFPIDWSKTEISWPKFIGTKVFTAYDISEIAEYIDWTPFFHSWELKGSYPKILNDAERGTEATKLFNDAQKMLHQIINEKWLQANAVIGVFPANAVGDDIHLDANGNHIVFHTLRQQTKKPAGQYNLALSDFVAPKDLTLIPSPKEREANSKEKQVVQEWIESSPKYHTTDWKTWNSNIGNAKNMRKNPTEAEDKLWQAIRDRKLEYKFRRQHPVDKFIADFVCIEAKLIIEVDGEIHSTQKEYDNARTYILNDIGYRVIRFSNKDVLNNFLIVLEKIKEELKPLSLGEGLGVRSDYIGCFALTTGIGIDEHVARFEADHDDYSSIMLKALADRLAEAFAELMHKKVRKEIWAYAQNEDFKNEDLIKEEYAGIRPAPGYPAQPDHTEKLTIWKILNVEQNIGITLTDSLAMVPTAAVSGLYLANPNAHYFGIGKIKKDQVADYAVRKGMSLEDTERWLGPNLGY